MPCWYWDKKDLDNSPSRKQGVTPENENRYRREGSRFIYKLGKSDCAILNSIVIQKYFRTRNEITP